MMDANEYQRRALLTDAGTQVGDSKLVYPVLGLAGEAGELANKLKKVYRDNGGKVGPAEKLNLAYELGDVLWYVAVTAYHLDLKLSEVMEMNNDKLMSRFQKGTLGGSGDER